MLLADKLFESYLQEYMWKKQHQDIFFGGISSPKHPSHTETGKYIFLIDFGTLNTNL